MRFVAFILGILGSLLAAMLGIYWLDDIDKASAGIETLRSAGALSMQMAAQIEARTRGGYALLLALPLGIAGSIVTLKGRGKPGGALMLAAAVFPAFFVGGALMFTFPLLLAGLFALASKPKRILA